jgi:serine/threonine protein kinase/Flp pilus assembly protein TadD
MIGTHVGPYEIVERLGVGGMGEVYRARDSRLDRDVAIKMVSGVSTVDAPLDAYLLHEARQASSLNHPHICHVYDVGEVGGRPYIAMEFVPGQTLLAFIPDQGLPVETLTRIGQQLSGAVAHAHERGLIHRDLKAANIIITPGGEAKVLDFGLAKRLTPADVHEVTRSHVETGGPGTLAGTLPYMAPELLRGEEATERSDIWALGILLYEMAAGRRPFTGGTGFELSSAILNDPVPALAGRVPPAIEHVIRRCLERDPNARYQHAREVRAALEVASQPTMTGPPGVDAARARAGRRWWPAAALVGLLLVALGTWRITSTRSSAPHQEPPPNSAMTRAAPGGVTPGTPLRPSKRPEANEHFQRAMLVSMSSLDLPRVRASYERALELDPQFAEARAEYAFSLALEVIAGFSNDAQWFYRAEEELRRALRDDPDCGRAHSALAGIYLMQGRKELVPAEVDRALAVNASDMAAWGWLTWYHRFLGDYDRAREVASKALAISPLFFPVRMGLGEALLEGGDTPGALREHEKLREQSPENPAAVFTFGHTYLVAGETKKAREALEAVPARLRGNYLVRLHEALLLASEGDAPKAVAVLDADLLNFSGILLRASVQVPEIYAAAGKPQEALDWLDKSVRLGDERAEWLERNPLLKNIQGEPRFAQILESIRYRRAQRQKEASR